MTDTLRDVVLRALEREERSQRWLARKIGMDPTYLNHILAGRKSPPETFYRDVALVLRLPEGMLRPREEGEAA